MDEAGGHFYEWMNNPVARIFFALILLSILAYLAKRFVGGFFPGLIFRLLLISLLGVAIYSIIIMQKGSPPSRSFEKTIEPYLPSPAPINKAREQVKKFEESQRKKDELINSPEHSEEK